MLDEAQSRDSALKCLLPENTEDLMSSGNHRDLLTSSEHGQGSQVGLRMPSADTVHTLGVSPYDEEDRRMY